MYKLNYPDLAETLYTALLDDPFYIALVKHVKGGTPSRKEALIKYMDYSMYEAAQYGLLYIPNKHPYGAAIWSKPLDTDIELIRSQQKKDFLKANLGTE